MCHCFKRLKCYPNYRSLWCLYPSASPPRVGEAKNRSDSTDWANWTPSVEPQPMQSDYAIRACPNHHPLRGRGSPAPEFFETFGFVETVFLPDSAAQTKPRIPGQANLCENSCSGTWKMGNILAERSHLPFPCRAKPRVSFPRKRESRKERHVGEPCPRCKRQVSFPRKRESRKEDLLWPGFSPARE